MGRRGPKPKPTALKIAQGNPGKRALSENEPVPPAGDIVPPDWLSFDGRRIWDSIAPVAIAMRTLTTADVLTFARYCDRFARYLELKAFVREKLHGNPFYVRYDDKGKIVYSGEFPQNQEMKNLSRELLQFEREFGFTPSSRTRIEVEHAPGAATPAAGAKSGTSEFERDFPATNPLPFTRTA